MFIIEIFTLGCVLFSGSRLMDGVTIFPGPTKKSKAAGTSQMAQSQRTHTFAAYED